MSNNWNAFSIDLGGIEDAANAVGDATTAIGTVLDLTRTAMEIVSALVIDKLNVEAALIGTALSAVEAIINQYLETDARIHVLVVPPRKQSPYNLASEFTMPQKENSWELSDTLSPEAKQAFQNTLFEMSHYDQGNLGFGRTVAESLDDEFDANRPDYDANAAIYAKVILVGGQTMVSLYDFLLTLRKLFGTSLGSNPLLPASITRTPQNLVAIPIAAPAGGERLAVKLEWENPPALQSFAQYDGVFARIDEVSIIRSTTDEAMTASNWSDLFGADQPEPLGEEEFEKEDALIVGNGESNVIKQYKFNGIRDVFIDEDPDLKKYKDYYYCVAYRYALADPANEAGEVVWERQDYQPISNTAKVRVENQLPSSRRGPQPDWHTHPSLLSLFPDLYYLLNLLSEYVSSLGSQISGASSALQSYIDFLKAEAERLIAFAEAINARVAKLASLTQIPSAGLYATTIDSDAGGNEFFIQELISRLADKSDPTAPPFFKRGFTAGLVILAGAPNPANLEPVKDLMDLLTTDEPVRDEDGNPVDGSSGGTGTPYEQAVDSIDRVLAEVEVQTEEDFTNSMKLLDKVLLDALEAQGLTGDDLTDAVQKAREEIEEERAKQRETAETFDDRLQPVEPTDPTANVPFDP